MANSTKSIWAVIAVAAVAIALGIAVQLENAPTQKGPKLNKAVLLPATRNIPQTQFISHTGEPFSTAQFRGQWDVLFFGFTYCPDICPTTLYALKQAKQRLENTDEWANLRVVMVSVDPQRDTPERLAQYVPFFDPEFLGITSDLNSLADFTKGVSVLFKAHEPDAAGNYDVDHTAALILIDPQGQFAGVIPAPHEVDDLVLDLAALAGAETAANPSAPTSEKPEPEKQKSALTIEDAWIRAAPPGSDALAAYATIVNSGEAAEIVAVTSPMFEEAMIHSTQITDGVASMQMLHSVNLAANTQLTLKPMGTHIMLLEPVSEIAVGDLVPITFKLADGSSVQHIFEVKMPNDVGDAE